jgi:hypothetical protein
MRVSRISPEAYQWSAEPEQRPVANVFVRSARVPTTQSTERMGSV